MSKLSHYRHDIGMSSLPWRIHALLAWSDLLHPLKNRPNDLQISLMSATSSNDCENKLICLSVHQRKIITHSPIESPSLAPRGFSSSLHDWHVQGFSRSGYSLTFFPTSRLDCAFLWTWTCVRRSAGNLSIASRQATASEFVSNDAFCVSSTLDGTRFRARESRSPSRTE